MMKTITLSFITSLLLVPPLSAEVVTDGSLGAKLDLSGPDFQIDSKLGQQVGGNLFHSFQDFNLQSQESATFSGPNNVQNIISRVTGGNPSNIDGLIRSTIPNADLYFLNPYGILFGPNAQLDLQGGFHASTADYLRLQDEGRFDVRTPNNSLLTVAPVETFGFLTDNPAPIHLQGSKLRTLVPEKDFSLIGGDITIDKAGRVLATNGTLRVISIASAGDILFKESQLQGFSKLGTITLQGEDEFVSNLSASGPQGGKIFIRGGKLLLDKFAGIYSVSRNSDTGGGMDINVAEEIKLQGFSIINTSNYNNAIGGPIMIKVPHLTLTDGSQINTIAVGTNKGGDLSIEADEIILSGVSKDTVEITGVPIRAHASSGLITSFQSTEKAEQQSVGGNLKIKANHLVVKDMAQVSAHTLGFNHAGGLELDVSKIEVTHGGLISSSTAGDGYGGLVKIKAEDISLSDASYIFSVQFSPNSGKTGDISIEANNLIARNGGSVSVATMGLALPGTINMTITNHLELSGKADVSLNTVYDNLNAQVGGIFERAGLTVTDFIGVSSISAAVLGSQGYEDSGSIEIQAGQIDIVDGAKISSENSGLGDAGSITIRSGNDVHIHSSQAIITTEAKTGGGGNITIETPNLLHMQAGQITTSVGTGKGDGGNITVEKPQFVVLNRGQIKAQADEGHGGNIRIVAEQFIKSPDSLISASSRLGVDGNITVDSPEESVSDSLVVLSGDRIDAASMLKKPCSEYVAEADRSHFYVNPINGVRPAPHDRQGSNILPALSSQQTTNTTTASSVTECKKNTVKPKQNTSTTPF